MVMKNKKYISISEVSEILKIKQHVIRYWDSQFESVSTRLDNKKRRYFNSMNIKKLQTLKRLLHTEGKSHHSLEMARKIINDNIIEKKFDINNESNYKEIDINKLILISESLKSLLR